MAWNIADPVLIAQGLGAFGFVLIFLSPFVRRRRVFLLMDISGLAPVALHYALLGAPVGAALSLLYIAMDVVSGLRVRYAVARYAYWLFYPAGIVITYLTFSSLYGLAALAGTLFAIRSRQHPSFATLKILIFLSAVGWGVYGFYAQSWSQMIFSVAYAGSSLFGATRELRRPTHG
jgi:hypothetical protein